MNYLCHRFHNEGFDVTMDNLITGSLKNIEDLFEKNGLPS